MRNFVLFFILLVMTGLSYPSSMDAHCGCGHHRSKPPKEGGK